MKKLKNLILKISAEMTWFVLKSFVITMLISFAYTFLLIILLDKGPITNYYLFMGLIIIYGVFVILTSMVWLIIKLKITGFATKKNRIIFLHEPGGGEIYKSPQWKKIPYSIIKLPDNWKEAIAAGGKKNVKFLIDMVVNRNDILWVVYVPVTISFYFNGLLDICDLEKLTLISNKKKLKRAIVDIEEYLKSTFFSLSLGPDQMPRIRQAAIDWLSGKGSQVYLTKTVEQATIFPDKIFSNVEKTEIKIGLADSRIHPINDILINQSLSAQTNQY